MTNPTLHLQRCWRTYHEELRNDGRCVYQWCATGYYFDKCRLQAAPRQNEQAFLCLVCTEVPRDGQLYALSCKYPLCKQESLYETLLPW